MLQLDIEKLKKPYSPQVIENKNLRECNLLESMWARQADNLDISCYLVSCFTKFNKPN